MMAAMVQQLTKENAGDPYRGGIPPTKHPQSSVPSGTGRSLETGVKIRASSCTADEQQDVGVNSKYIRGDTFAEQNKIK